MKLIPFTKMEGTGNDFIMIDNRQGLLSKVKLADFVARICNRRYGVGADGAIILENDRQTAFVMRYINCNGEEAAMCGNGARCIARFAHRLGVVDKKFSFRTKSGIHEAEIIDEEVKLRFGTAKIIRKDLIIEVGEVKYDGDLIDSGVPHFVAYVTDTDAIDVKKSGRTLRNVCEFGAEGTNVDFIQIAKDLVKIRTYERGIENETLSCGTGAVAATLSLVARHNIPSPVLFQARGGKLKVHFNKDKKQPDLLKVHDIYLEGDARFICDGIYYF